MVAFKDAEFIVHTDVTIKPFLFEDESVVPVSFSDVVQFGFIKRPKTIISVSVETAVEPLVPRHAPAFEVELMGVGEALFINEELVFPFPRISDHCDHIPYIQRLMLSEILKEPRKVAAFPKLFLTHDSTFPPRLGLVNKLGATGVAAPATDYNSFDLKTTSSDSLSSSGCHEMHSDPVWLREVLSSRITSSTY